MRTLLFCSALLILAGSSFDLKGEENQTHLNLLYYQDDSGNRRSVKSVEDWQKRKTQILNNMQKVMGPLPSPAHPTALQVRILEEQPSAGYLRQKISYHTDSDQQVVHAYRFIPDRAKKKPVPAILCLHQTTKVGKEEPAGISGLPHLHYALELARRGYVTLAPDYPSFGEYAYEFGHTSGYQSGSMKAIYDNIRAVDLLSAMQEVDAERIGCLGHSLGGHNSMFTAAFEPRIKVIVSNCGFTRFHKYYGGKLKGWTSDRYMPLINSEYNNDPNQVPFDFPEIIGSFAPRPFLASSPLRDSNFEVSGVREALKIARPVYELYNAEAGLQSNYPDCAHDFPIPVRERAYSFFDSWLKHTPTTTEVYSHEPAK